MNGTRGLIIAVVAAFVVGVSAGLVGGILLMRFATPPYAMRPPGPGAPGMLGPPGAPGHLSLLHRLVRELELAPEQRERVVAVLERTREEHVATRESVRVRIERELTPAQRERWRELEDRYRRSWQRRPGRRDPFDGRP